MRELDIEGKYKVQFPSSPLCIWFSFFFFSGTIAARSVTLPSFGGSGILGNIHVNLAQLLSN